MLMTSLKESLLGVVLPKWLHEIDKVFENHLNSAYYSDKKEWQDCDFPELTEYKGRIKLVSREL